MASWDAWMFIFSLLDGTSLLFLAVYFIITLSDLECDYINATMCCSRLNIWIVPEFVAFGIMVFFQIITFHWILFIINLPLASYQIYRYLSKPKGFIGIFDPAEIHNRHMLKGYMKEAMIKLGYHLVFFFIYLYSMIVALVGGD